MGEYATIVLGGVCRESGPLTSSPLVRTRSFFRIDRFLTDAEYILARKQISTVVLQIRPDFRVQLIASLEMIRSTIERLRDGGKEIIVVAVSFGASELLIGSVAAKRYLHPAGTLRYTGVKLSWIFLGGLLERLRIDLDAPRRGEYKTAVDRFTRNALQRTDREQYGEYVDGAHDLFVTALRNGYGISAKEIEELMAGRIYSASEAQEKRWVTGVRRLREIERELEQVKLKKRPLPTRTGWSFGPGPLRSRRQIAVLEFEGAIADGGSSFNPVTGQIVGADAYIPFITAARKRRAVAAVVLRINSGGGTITASDDILAELRLLAEKKPLIVSMGDVAASGGYWIALAAKRIFAQRMTLTGSIGVFALLPSVRRALEALGIRYETMQSGTLADLESIFHSRNAAEQSIVDKEIGRLYELFRNVVATARSRSEEQVEAVARGRVWTGARAVDHSLVDRTGDLIDAISYAKEFLSMRSGRIVFYPRVRRTVLQRLLLSGVGVRAVSIGEELASAIFALSGSVRSPGPPRAEIAVPTLLFDPDTGDAGVDKDGEAED